MTEIKPCLAFINATPEEQTAKIMEEVSEVYEALKAYNKNPESTEKFGQLVEEIVDVQVAMETFLAILGLDEEGRDAVRAKIYIKNLERGYYDRRKPDDNAE